MDANTSIVDQMADEVRKGYEFEREGCMTHYVGFKELEPLVKYARHLESTLATERAENAALRKVVKAAKQDKSNCLDFCKGDERCWMQNTCDALAALEAAKEAK